MGLWDLPITETDSICFFQNCGILPKTRECSYTHPMVLHIPKNGIPTWKCTISNCVKYSYLRDGNWFDDSLNTILFTTAVRFIYCWSRELTTVKFCEAELDMNAKCALYWNTKLGEVCAVEMYKEQGRIKRTMDSLEWKVEKSKTKSPRDRAPDIAEFTFRKLQTEKGIDCFEAILDAISSQYPPEVKMSTSPDPSDMPVEMEQADNEQSYVEIKSEPENNSE